MVFIKFDTFLNDIIIDFYLMYLLHTLPEHLQEEIQIFPTSFYKRLCDVEHTIKGGMNITGMTHSEKMHLGVQKWTKNQDIFKKKLLLFPVCRSAHWFLIVVLLPELLLMQKGPETETAETAVIVGPSGVRAPAQRSGHSTRHYFGPSGAVQTVSSKAP